MFVAVYQSALLDFELIYNRLRIVQTIELSLGWHHVLEHQIYTILSYSVHFTDTQQTKQIKGYIRTNELNGNRSRKGYQMNLSALATRTEEFEGPQNSLYHSPVNGFEFRNHKKSHSKLSCFIVEKRIVCFSCVLANYL